MNNLTKNLTYSDISADISELGDDHDLIIEDLNLARHSIQEKALYSHNNEFANGIPAVLTKENYVKANSVKRSIEYDSVFTKNFLFNKSDYLAKAGQN
jgi:hypothetical protein